ncbi:DMT family transporter [Neobacillus bataviensis]|uniref:DMT family transporter n=1 Tax=Neobacillus bataviensis TaxID=220685 RepID=UPI001CBF4B99|nr:EamA family transporter [Neobacillus bataviensis]
MKKSIPIVLISTSAALWGIIAIFIRKLSSSGFSPMEIVTLRVITAAVLLGLLGVFQYRSQLRIAYKDLPLFIGTGLCSIVLFNWCYFSAINQMNLSIAVILLYTAPAFVTVLSYFFLKEKMNSIKLISVTGTILGCILIAGLNLNDTSSISGAGLLTGLGAGFGYALYSIFGKFALKKYPPFTVTFYTFVVAAISLLPLTGLWTKVDILMNGDVVFYAIGLGVFPTVLAYLLYTKGLEDIETSKAAIIATVEPVVATLLSVFVYNENFGAIQGIGSTIILLSVLFINLPVGFERRIQKEKASIK